MSVFLGTLGYVFVNYRQLMTQASVSPLTSIFFPIMVVWSMCLVYFFGFFGISFLDTEEISESPSTFGLAQLEQEASQQLSKSKSSSASSSSTSKINHQPRNDTLLCSEKPAVVNTSSTDDQSSTVGAPLLDETEVDFKELNDEEVFEHLVKGSLKDYQLEKKLGDYERAVSIRRRLYESLLGV